MKKTVLVFGLLSGAVSAAMMLATMPFMHTIGFDHGLVVGYTAIVCLPVCLFGIRWRSAKPTAERSCLAAGSPSAS